MPRTLTYEITAAGTAAIHSDGFAELLFNEMVDMRSAGMPPAAVNNFGITFIAWVLTGHDMHKPPRRPNEMLAVVNFVNTHVAEMNGLVDDVFAAVLAKFSTRLGNA